MTQAYPLQWPVGQPRTNFPSRSRFDMTFDRARRELQHEIELLGGVMPVLSTNVELRMDGQPYANRRDPEDTGVAVYFDLGGDPMVFACDRWDRVKDNIRAISKTIEALRGMDRWGVSEARRQAFTGFKALPAPKSCWEILGLKPSASANQVKSAFKRLAVIHHPDRGGSHEAMAELSRARDEALKEIGA